MKISRKELKKLIISEMRRRKVGGGEPFEGLYTPRDEINTDVMPRRVGNTPGEHFILKEYIPYDYGSVKYYWYKDCTKKQMYGFKGHLVQSHMSKDYQSHILQKEPTDYEYIRVGGVLKKVPIKKDHSGRFSTMGSSRDTRQYDIMGPYDTQTIQEMLDNPNYNWSDKVSGRYRIYNYD